MSSADETFDPKTVLEVLKRHGLEFIVIGAIAAIAQGYPLNTSDVDVTPLKAPWNLERLAAALRELDAKLRTSTDAVPLPVDAEMLGSADSWTLATSAGPLDVVFVPAGTSGYADLRRAALEVDLGVPVLVAFLGDVIRSKEASGRNKDKAQLPALRQTLEVIRERKARERRS